ncbi:hypothetical protein D3C76_1573060 [compost metagenome]
MSVVNLISVALPAIGVIVKGSAAGMFTPATLKLRVCAAALFRLKSIVATPPVKFTVTTLGEAVKATPSRLP